MLILKKELLKRITEHAIREFPNEACGILAGSQGRVEKVYEMTNAEASPQTFFMDAREQLKAMKEVRNEGQEMVGIYHSHVASEACPSSHDVELALYPEVSYVIISLKDKKNPSIRSFKIKEEKITEEELRIE
ncbi:MAG: M67 family metallopeptidase [Candidatus Omnitrophota bacterium]